MTIAIDERALIAQLLASPKLPLIAQEIKEVLSDEKAKRQEFYNNISEGDKAEYINGEMILHSPVKSRHSVAVKRLLLLLDHYVERNNLGFVGYEKIMISLSRNDYEPDICYFGRNKSDAFTDDQMLFPAPDFIAEVLSDSTESNDRGVKFTDYAIHGVTEYWIIDPVQLTLEQYKLVDEQYELVMKSGNGHVSSIVLPEFSIPIEAIFDDAINRQALDALSI